MALIIRSKKFDPKVNRGFYFVKKPARGATASLGTRRGWATKFSTMTEARAALRRHRVLFPSCARSLGIFDE